MLWVPRRWTSTSQPISSDSSSPIAISARAPSINEVEEAQLPALVETREPLANNLYSFRTGCVFEKIRSVRTADLKRYGQTGNLTSNCCFYLSVRKMFIACMKSKEISSI